MQLRLSRTKLLNCSAWFRHRTRKSAGCQIVPVFRLIEDRDELGLLIGTDQGDDPIVGGYNCFAARNNQITIAQYSCQHTLVREAQAIDPRANGMGARRHDE